MRTLILANILFFLTVATDAQVWIDHVVDAEYNSRSVYAADMDNDGDVDILKTDLGNVLWHENNSGDGTVWTERLIGSAFSGATGVVASDVDGDGDLDVLAAASHDDDISWWENLEGNGTAWIEHLIGANFHNARVVFPVDMDNDGDVDVVGTAFDVDLINWWENTNGDGSVWAEHSIAEGFESAWGIYVCDIDGDEDLDVAGTAFWGDEVAWFENSDGAGTTWIQHSIDNQFSFPQSVWAQDMDFDGDADVICGSSQTGGLVWWENIDGNGTNWLEHVIDGDYYNITDIQVVDMDNDGDPDLIGNSYTESDEIRWWENIDGNGASWTTYTVDRDYETDDLWAADINGNGVVDIASAAGYLLWFERTDLTVVVDAPNGGESWEVYTTQDIRWNSFASGNVILELLQGENVVQSIAEVPIYNRVYSWSIPGILPPDDTYRVRATAVIDGIPDESDDPFTLFNNHPLRVYTPNGYEDWRMGTIRKIKWVIPGIQEGIRIELYDGFEQILVIADSTENDGVFEWNIPLDLVIGDNYRIRLSSISGEQEDISDNAFSIIEAFSVTLTPFDPPVVIQPYGGGFWFWVAVGNPAPVAGTGQIWTEVTLPDDTNFGPLDIMTYRLDPFTEYSTAEPLSQWVPDYAPAGVYEFVICMGLFPRWVVTSDSFEFEKLAGANFDERPMAGWSVDDWKNSGWTFTEFTEILHAERTLPKEVILHPAHPNPFNPLTEIQISLPDAAEVKIAVYNVTGQQVTTLADGRLNAGTHSLVFDASGLASGLYFVRMDVPGRFGEMQKVVLMK